MEINPQIHIPFNGTNNYKIRYFLTKDAQYIGIILVIG